MTENIFRVFRPELSDNTNRLYFRELKLLYKEFNVNDPLTLLEELNLLTLACKNIDHLFYGSDSKNTDNLRIAVYRNLLEIFKKEITSYNKIDTLILNYRISN